MTSTAITVHDRMSFTTIMAVAIHAIVILGVGFNSLSHNSATSSLEVTLSTHQERHNDKADYLALSDQKGSGTLDKRAEISSLTPISDGEAIQPSNTQSVQQLDAGGGTSAPVSQHQFTLYPSQPSLKEVGQQSELSPFAAERMVSLEARLAKQNQAYAKKPRIKTVTSVSTKSDATAAYLEQWRQKVEIVGNRNYPKSSSARRLYGSVQVKTSINSQGQLVGYKILKSSGWTIIDTAVSQILKKSTPFDPFPENIARNTDQLDIIRTWHFEPSGHLTTQ